MVLISHRGNINGVNPQLENTYDYIDAALDAGYEVELDVWSYDDKLYLGHDKPDREVSLEWLNERSYWIWIHCKNFKALSYLISKQLVLFYHSQEDYTLISNGMIWAHNISEVDDNCVIPLLSKQDVDNWTPTSVGGVCSDFIELLND